jgi:pyruvate decarboxylase
VTKEEELGKLLDTDKIRDKGCFQLVEVVVGRDDAPPALRRALGKPLDHEGTDTKINIGDMIYRLGMIGW